MSLPFKLPVNYRPIPVQISSESFTISGSTTLLAESPSDPNNPATPISVSVTGSARTRVTGSPGVGEYRISTQTVFNAANQARTVYLPVLEFNVADNNLSGLVTYYGVGTMLTTQLWSALIWLLTPLIDIASSAALNSAYPASTDQFSSGRPGRTAFLTDGSMYFSDGSMWRQVSGAGSGTTPGSWSDAMGISVGTHYAAAASYSGTWSAAESIASALHFDSFQSYVAAGINGYFGLNSVFDINSQANYTGSWSNASPALTTDFQFTNSYSYSAPAAPVSMSFVAAGTIVAVDTGLTTSTLNVPIGDVDDIALLVAFDNMIIEPSGGWNRVSFDTGSSGAGIWWKKYTSSGTQQSATFITYDDGVDGVYPTLMRVYTFRGVNTTNPIDAVSSVSGAINFPNSRFVHSASLSSSSSGSSMVFFDSPSAINKSASSASGSINTVLNSNQVSYTNINMGYDSNFSGLTGAAYLSYSTSTTYRYFAVTLRKA